MNELIELWRQLIGAPPSAVQWQLWGAAHGIETIRHGVIMTARKNLALGDKMEPDRRVKFASKVMLEKDRRDAEHGANRAALEKEFGGAQ